MLSFLHLNPLRAKKEMRNLNWKAKPIAIAVAVLLVLVLNPELRTFLLLLNFLGADLVLLLLGGYVYQYWSMFRLLLNPILSSGLTMARSFLKTMRWTAYGLHPRDGQWAQLDHLSILSSVATRSAWSRLAA